MCCTIHKKILSLNQCCRPGSAWIRISLPIQNYVGLSLIFLQKIFIHKLRKLKKVISPWCRKTGFSLKLIHVYVSFQVYFLKFKDLKTLTKLNNRKYKKKPTTAHFRFIYKLVFASTFCCSKMEKRPFISLEKYLLFLRNMKNTYFPLKPLI